MEAIRTTEGFLKKIAEIKLFRTQSLSLIAHNIRMRNCDGADLKQAVALGLRAENFVRDRWSSLVVRRKSKMDARGERHVNQLLASFAEVNLSSKTTIALRETTTTVDSLIDGAMANVNSTQELEWTCVALCHYRPDLDSWENRFGEKFTLERMAILLMDCNPSGLACWGSHRLFALAKILAANNEYGFLSSGVELKIRRVLQGSVFLFEEQISNVIAEDRENALSKIAHDLEWIGLLDVGFKVNYLHVGRALDFVMLEMEHIEVNAKTFAACSHAVKAVSVWGCRVGGK